MSLAQSWSHGPLGLKLHGKSKKSESRPRFLKSMSFSADHHGTLMSTKLHGDASPQTPMHYIKGLSFAKDDILTSEHPRPWHFRATASSRTPPREFLIG